MKVITPISAKTFRGTDGETITIAGTGRVSGGIELSIRDGAKFFCAQLNSAEHCRLAKFMAQGYDPLTDHQHIQFTGKKGESLEVSHTNEGEPYRELLRFLVEGVEGIPGRLYADVSSDVMSEMHCFIASLSTSEA